MILASSPRSSTGCRIVSRFIQHDITNAVVYQFLSLERYETVCGERLVISEICSIENPQPRYLKILQYLLFGSSLFLHRVL